MTIGSQVIRTCPNGVRQTTFTIKSQKELDYHRELQDKGYKYTHAVTVHNMMQECEACSA